MLAVFQHLGDVILLRYIEFVSTLFRLRGCLNDIWVLLPSFKKVATITEKASTIAILPLHLTFASNKLIRMVISIHPETSYKKDIPEGTHTTTPHGFVIHRTPTLSLVFNTQYVTSIVQINQ